VRSGGLSAALPRTVVTLGLVSLANDAASEMLTPLLPIFLTATLGAGPAVVGLIEGVAEATASILKVVSGRLADRGLGAKRLVFTGYGASTLARPLIGLALGWTWVLALRFVDRVGKGIRTAPRDAMIAGAVAPGSLGRAFGFHRALDHGGAVIGPLLAFLLLAHRLGQHPQIMFRVLLKVFRGDTVIRQLGITRKLVVFLDDLLWRTAHFTFGSGGLENAVDDVSHRTVAVPFGPRT